MPFDKEKATGNIKEILEKMQNNTDITLLQEYYNLYKKEVSFFKRSMAAAWLFMYYDGKETPSLLPPVVDDKSKKKKQIIHDKKNPDNSDNSGEKNQPVILPEEESKRLFMSIGKNRRLFPREIIALILSKTSAEREDIGIIRILDNYSFVQVRDAKADEIIETLTGHKFRGRTLTVNFAKTKSGENEQE